MKTPKAYQAAWAAEFDKLTPSDKAAVLAAPDGAISAKLAAKAMSKTTTDDADEGASHTPGPWKVVSRNAAFEAMREVLKRILYAADSPSGAAIGEAALCPMFKDVTRAALALADQTTPPKDT